MFSGSLGSGAGLGASGEELGASGPGRGASGPAASPLERDVMNIGICNLMHLQIICKPQNPRFYSLRTTFWEVFRRESPWPSGRIFREFRFGKQQLFLGNNVVFWDPGSRCDSGRWA